VPFRVSGKNLDIGEALRRRVYARINDTLGKHFRGGYSGHVTVSREGFGFRTECAVHLPSGITLEAEAMAADAYASADQAAMRIEKRLRRYKQRLKDRHTSARGDGDALPPPDALEAPSYVIATPEHESEDEIAEFNPVIIAESTTALRRMPISEAVLELDMTGAPVVVFRHAGHGRINMVYRRADGHIGWIDLPSLPPEDSH
jgi:ribosomal subunit interface protein